MHEGQSETIERDLPGGHTKNLFLIDAKGRLFLVVAEAHTPVALNTLHKTIGSARLSFGKADLLEATLGVTPGSVTAFAVLADRERRVQVVLDRRLFAFDTINCHPMANTATTAIARADLVRFLEATGHPPVIADLTVPEAATQPTPD